MAAEGETGAPPYEHNGSRRILQSTFVGFVHDNACPDCVEPIHTAQRKHHSQGLVRTPLAGAQCAYGVIVRRIAHQMITAHALDPDNGAFAQCSDRRC